MVVESNALRACQILRLAVSRQRDQHRPGRTELVSEPFSNLVAVDPREANVQQDHVKRFGRGRLNRFEAVMGNAYLITPELQNSGEAPRRILTVVHHEKPQEGVRRLCRG